MLKENSCFSIFITDYLKLWYSFPIYDSIQFKAYISLEKLVLLGSFKLMNWGFCYVTFKLNSLTYFATWFKVDFIWMVLNILLRVISRKIRQLVPTSPISLKFFVDVPFNGVSQCVKDFIPITISLEVNDI